MKNRSELKNPFWQPSTMYFEDVLVFDPDKDGWMWFFKGYKSKRKFSTYRKAFHNFAIWRGLVRQGKVQGMRHEVRTNGMDEVEFIDYRCF